MQWIAAFDALVNIVRTGVIRGGDGYVKARHHVVCFTETPLSALRYLIDDTANQGKYSYYGISISKQTDFRSGARPVIYLPDAEASWIPDQEKWRLVRFEDGQVDFTHEREWRLLGDLNLSIVNAGIYLIVQSPEEARLIASIDGPFQASICGVLAMHDLRQML